MAYFILGVGAVYRDIVLSVPEFKEDGKARAHSRVERTGGNATNSLKVLKPVLGRYPEYSLGLLFALGCGNGLGERMIQELESQSINVGCVLREGYDVPVAYVIEDEKRKSRSIVSWNKVPDLTSAELSSTLAELSRKILLSSLPSWIHIEGRNGVEIKNFLEDLASKHKDSTLPIISLDVEDSSRPGIVSLQSMADVLLFSGRDASMQKITGIPFLRNEMKKGSVTINEMIQGFKIKQSAVLFITLGSAGCLMLYSSKCRFPIPALPDHSSGVWLDGNTGEPRFRFLGNLDGLQGCSGDEYCFHEEVSWNVLEIGPLPDCNPIVETVGAGDTFNAGIILGLSQGLDVLAAGRLGNTIAGRKCMQTGFEGLWLL